MPSFKFHFKEIDWIIYLPSHGNEGRKSKKFGVTYLDRKKQKTQKGRMIELDDVLSRATIAKKHPHSVGFYLSSNGRGKTWEPDYLRTKNIKSKRGFYAFLKELGLS
jgi:hypothetical protein